MSNKKICIIRSNPVSPDSRVEKIAYTLTQNSYNVHILAWDRTFNHQPIEDRIVVSGVSIPITRLGYKASYGERFKMLRPYLQFQFAMRKWICKHSKDIDIIHACDFDTAFFSLSVALKFKKKFIFDIFDYIFSESHTILGRIVRYLENNIINKADATIICSDVRRQQIIGTKPKELVVIENSPFYNQITEEDVIKSNSDKIKVVYVGILQDNRLLCELGQYFANNHQYEFHVGGFGKYEDYFSKLSKGNENIFYYGKLTYDKTLALERACDIMLGIYNPSISNHKFAAPNKFYESLMLGKPIIMARGTGMSNIIAENDIGEIIEYSVEDFDRHLQLLLKRYDEWDNMHSKMIQLYDTHFSWKIMSARLIKLYKTLEK